MVQVSGPLKIMTDKPSRVSEVWVGSPQTRPHGGGLLVEERDKVAPVGGVLSFTSVPGPVLLTLVSGGRVVDSVKGVVPDAESATLAEVVASDHDWTPEQMKAFQQLTAQAKAASAIATVQATSAAGDAGRAEAAADRATAIADPMGVLGAAQDYTDARFAARTPRVLVFTGTGTPSISNFPDAKIGDIVERKSDGFRWEVQA